MNYSLFLYSDEAMFANATVEQANQGKAAYEAYIKALVAAGVFVTTDWLQPSTNATTISMMGGQRQVQDGPYASTKEQLGGFFVINVPNLDEALKWAAQCPAAHYGYVEVRPSMMGE
jgi:hypothetical protein